MKIYVIPSHKYWSRYIVINYPDPSRTHVIYVSSAFIRKNLKMDHRSSSQPVSQHRVGLHGPYYLFD
ncbi:hypothetical protein RchiOBHm_Chr5g0071421 [Rosa chinensis]|uniref:Uncharacterized protein n=1 Tax=Rosa chinensis TaxID=74649 RepID=A0A2P6QKE2_ROSCH|nr:hypothetical protein RchiOBHm_Chr5g0071421 [Rosa chinensis]